MELEGMAMGALDRPNSFLDEMGEAISRLQALSEAEGVDTRELAITNGIEVLLRATRASLAVVASMGECRRDVPYSTLRPILDSNNQLKWCCNHSPEHCG